MESKQEVFKKEKKEKLSPEQYHAKIEKSLKYSISDGAFYSIMQGITSSFLVPYAILLQASTIVLGILGTFPELLGALLQFFTKKLFLTTQEIPETLARLLIQPTR